MFNFTRLLHSSSTRLVSVAAMSLLLAGAFAACGKTPVSGPIAAVAPAVKLPTHITLTIVAQKPGGTLDGPAYMPDTNLTLPAHSLITITIINKDDPGDDAIPASSPFNTVQGVVGGSAYLDGVAYKSLSRDKIAHTFTVPGLGVNVPIPGDVPAGHKDITVTFSFKTGAAGLYYWQCMDPCGSDPNGWGGPMSTTGYMKGALTVQA
jgi:hypothetical protein